MRAIVLVLFSLLLYLFEIFHSKKLKKKKKRLDPGMGVGGRDIALCYQ